MDKEIITKALDAIFETMNVSRAHLVPNVSLREAFEEDFKSLKSEYRETLNRLLPRFKRNSSPDTVEIATCFYSEFMRWLSKFIGGLHLELNSEDLDRCKLSRSDIGRLGSLDDSSGDLGRSDSTLSMSDGTESSTCIDKLEAIDPRFFDNAGGNFEEMGDPVIVVGNGDDDNDKPPIKKMRID